LKVASTLLKCGFDTEVKNGEGDTALHIAAQFNHLSIVIELCQRNANINATDHHGLTVLHRAVCFGRKEIVSYLMDAGAQLGNVDNGIDALLYLAAQEGQAAIAEVALSSRFYITQAAMDSRQISLFRAAECGHTEVVNVLLQHGVDIESTDAKGWTALHKACYASKMETVCSLIQQGADKEAKDKKNGWTSLFLAAKDPKIILLLLSEGADIEARTDHGLTALHYYTSIGQVDVIHLLLNYGCNIESRDISGHNALHYAVEHNQAESMKILLDNGLDPYIGNSRGYTAFHQSAQNSNEKMMKILLDNGFNIDTKGGPDRMTALLFAILHSNLRAVQFLLAHGASVNTIDIRGRTSLHYAAKRNDLEIAEMLLNSGVAVNTLDDFGESALDFAAVDDNLPIVAILVRSGANIMPSGQPNEGRMSQYRTRVVRTIEQTASNEVFNASAPIRHDEEDMILSRLKVKETLVILKKTNQGEFQEYSHIMACSID
jgi:ankyrin repeat protein